MVTQYTNDDKATQAQLAYIDGLLAETNSDFDPPVDMTKQTASDIIKACLDHKASLGRGPNWYKVTSSNVSEMAFYYHKLLVRFNNGSEYEFYDVPPALYHQWRKAESKGKFFHEHIKGRYHYTKTREAAPVLPDVPEGRYAINDPAQNGKLRFFRYTANQRKELILRELFGAPGSFRVAFVSKAETHRLLALFEKVGVDAARFRFGQEVGACGVCGSPLTDELSRKRGIGPVCWEKGLFVEEVGPDDVE